MRITKSEISMHTWRSPMNAASQGAFAVIPEILLCEFPGIQNYLWDDLFVGWTCGMLISFDVCCGTDLWDCTMLKGNRF